MIPTLTEAIGYTPPTYRLRRGIFGKRVLQVLIDDAWIDDKWAETDVQVAVVPPSLVKGLLARVAKFERRSKIQKAARAKKAPVDAGTQGQA